MKRKGEREGTVSVGVGVGVGSVLRVFGVFLCAEAGERKRKVWRAHTQSK